MIPWIGVSSRMSSSVMDFRRPRSIGWSNVYVPRHSRYLSTVGPKGCGFTLNGASGRGAHTCPSYSSLQPIHWLSTWSSYVSVAISWDSRPQADRGAFHCYSGRRHHVLISRTDDRGAPHLHHARHILGLLGPAAKQGEVLGRLHRLVLGGISLGLYSAGYTRLLASHPLPRASSGRGKTPRSRLAAGNDEDRGSPWGLASGSASLMWWSLGDVAICIGGHSYIFYGYIPDAGRGVVPDREHHAALLSGRGRDHLRPGRWPWSRGG